MNWCKTCENVVLQPLILPSLIGLLSLILLKFVKTENNSNQPEEENNIDLNQNDQRDLGETVTEIEDEDGVIHNEEAENDDYLQENFQLYKSD